MTYTATITCDDCCIFGTPLISDNVRDAIDEAEGYVLMLGANGYRIRDTNGREVGR